MATYSTMQARIADELARADLTSQIQYAILDTIKDYERRRWPWNELKDATFSTVASQEYYGSSDLSYIPSLVKIDSLYCALNASSATPRMQLRKREHEWIAEKAAATTVTVTTPTDYCYYSLQIRLYPIPSGTRTVTLNGVYKLTALAAGSDTNAWTTDAEEMVRMAAKVRLLRNVIRSEAAFAEADMLSKDLAGVENDLEGENDNRIVGGIRASYL